MKTMAERKEKGGTGQLQHFELIQPEESKDDERDEALDEETGMSVFFTASFLAPTGEYGGAGVLICFCLSICLLQRNCSLPGTF